MTKGLLSKLGDDVLLLDGATGSVLQGSLAGPGTCLEELNLAHPEMVREMHRAYVDAGVDIIETNTLGANRIKLGDYGLGHRVEEINRNAVKIAREASSGKCLVALSVGPTGKFLEPVGNLTFHEALDIFRQQIKAAAIEGIDLVVIETMSDLKELRAAVIAAKEVISIPVMATMSFQEDGRTLLGTSPEVAAVCMESLGVSIIGANCGIGPEAMLPVLKELRRATKVKVAVQPNAGMPRLEDGRTVFPATPEEMADFYIKFVREGANVIGGCCGTTPRHMRAMVKAVAGMKPARIDSAWECATVTSRSRVIGFGYGLPPVAIGERINPTGRRELSRGLAQGKLDTVLKEAREQAEAGADMLDINVGLPIGDEMRLMSKVILTVQQHVAVPLALDSASAKALEAGLMAADGKVLINSVNGEREKLESVLPLAVKYGAAVIGLTIDSRGVPQKARERLEIAERILDAALQAGLPKKSLVIDCLTLAISSEQEMALETLRAIELIRQELGLPVVLGISNVSFGLPNRSLLNSAFLAMALSRGLDGAIINPKDARIMEIFRASSVLANRDKKALRYIQQYGQVRGEGAAVKGEEHLGLRQKLFRAVVVGRREEILTLVEEALNEGTDPLEMSSTLIIPALDEVGRYFENKDFFLPQVMLSAETAKIAFRRIKEELKGRGPMARGKIIMATVLGDVHDIGKNIVSMLLENHGYEVLDLGVNVPPEKIALCAEKNSVDIIGLSALMTTTMLEMGKTVRFLRENGITCPIMVGGAAVTPEFANEIGADAYGKNAIEAVNIAKKLVLAKR